MHQFTRRHSSPFSFVSPPRARGASERDACERGRARDERAPGEARQRASEREVSKRARASERRARGERASERGGARASEGERGASERRASQRRGERASEGERGASERASEGERAREASRKLQGHSSAPNGCPDMIFSAFDVICCGYFARMLPNLFPKRRIHK